MPWVVYDPDDGTYLCQEEHGNGAPDDLSDGLWQKDVTKATGFDTFAGAASAFAEIDVEEWLPHIRPIWVERPPPASVRRPWNELTFAEKMEQIEEDFNESIAQRVQRTMMEVTPEVSLLDGAFIDDRPKNVRAWSETGRLIGSTPSRQYIPRTKFVDYIGLPPAPFSEHAKYDGILKKLSEMQLPPVIMPCAPTPLPSHRPLPGDILDVDYASLELRTLSQITTDNQRDPHGRKEEEGFQPLHCIVVHACCRGDASRRELPDDQGSAGSGKRAGGTGGGKG
jgi:hypothetical protein